MDKARVAAGRRLQLASDAVEQKRQPGIPDLVMACVLLFTCLFTVMPGTARAQASSTGAIIWTGAGIGLLGAFVFDRHLREEAIEPGQALAPLSRIGNRIGRPEIALPVTGLVYGLGRLSNRPQLAGGALHTAGALVAAGIVNGVLKVGFGRGRPDHVGYDSDEFRPMSFADHWQSFPSGHTMVAFSLATAIAEEIKNPWVSGLAYGTAAMVGWSRVYDNRHWTSDVVAGAILGTVVSRWTVRWLHSRSVDENSMPNLMISPAGLAIRVPVR